ncbi:MAG: Maf family nucleotide pyrophosphatase [Bdellovibrionota bacterium]|nr:Maf family nucleotide pyrophosphatase [Bdellovibrionota bacterium]
MKLLLASTSPYRRAQLEQICQSFETYKTDFDEEPLKLKFKDKPVDCALALSEAKAKNALLRYEDHIVVAGDQVAEFEGRILSKTASMEKSVEQLLEFSGKSLSLHTAITLAAKESLQSFVVPSHFHFRSLKRKEVEDYVQFAQPTDCAGSFKIEMGGIALFEKIETSDFSSIQGLPLIELSRRLRSLGVELFK